MPAETISSDQKVKVYIGTYTGAKSKGIYLSQFDPEKGQLSEPELVAETANPSFLAVDPQHRALYAVGEVSEFDGKPSGAVSAFRIDQQSGKLALLNRQSSGGTGPCHLAVARSGQCVVVANYGSGSVAALPIAPGGMLREAASIIQHQGSSVNPQRQAGPHAHFITADPNDRFALACDLGLDQVLVYRLDAAKASLTANEPSAASLAPGAGPRHLAFHPSSRFVYVINEMGSTLTAFGYDPKRGGLKQQVQTISTLPKSFSGNNTCAEVQVHPSGKFVYASNRGDDSIAVFSADSRTGRLTWVERQSTRGKTPRHFAIDPSGRWLLAENQDSNNVVIFRLDRATGRLSPTGTPLEVAAPVCLVFVPAR